MLDSPTMSFLLMFGVQTPPVPFYDLFSVTSFANCLFPDFSCSNWSVSTIL